MAEEELQPPGGRYERRILVTGGAGFIGSHVVIRLVRNYPQYKVVNLDKLDYCSSLKNLQSICDAPNYKFVKGSITSADLVNYILRVEKIDTIMHFAAQTHVDNSFGNSIAFTESNILGTHVMLEAAKEARIKLFIHVSTDEVYGEGSSGIASHEGSVLEPTNPYAATKAGAEYLVKAYHRSFDLPVIITRGNNVYGPHQFPEKIIPKFVNQLMRGLPMTVHGSGSNTRNYLYVEDCAAAFDLILHRGKPGDVYNMGSVNEVSNLEVARSVLRQMKAAAPQQLVAVATSSSSSSSSACGGSEAASDAAPTQARASAVGVGAASGLSSPTSSEAQQQGPQLLDKEVQELSTYVLHVSDRPFNDLRYPLDCSRLLALGWKESVTWEEGMARTVAWYLRYSNNWHDVEDALVPHPRRGHLAREVILGLPERDDEEEGFAVPRLPPAVALKPACSGGSSSSAH